MDELEKKMRDQILPQVNSDWDGGELNAPYSTPFNAGDSERISSGYALALADEGVAFGSIGAASTPLGAPLEVGCACA